VIAFRANGMQALELMVPQRAVALLLAAAMWFASRFGPSLDLPLLARSVAFGVLAVAGAAIAIAANVAFRRARTTPNPFRPQQASSLVTTEVYRFTRNPMYLGLLVGLLGWAAFLCSASALLGPVAFVAYSARFQIVPEERLQLAKFGAAYAEYATRVRRWL
jgi:protein-S-isoprenylcysteine O-methyltransferase Ste14